MRVCHWDVDLDMEVRGFLKLEGAKDVGEEKRRERSMYKSLGATEYRVY